MGNITHVNVTFFEYVKHTDRAKIRALYFSNVKNIILVCVVVLNSKGPSLFLHFLVPTTTFLFLTLLMMLSAILLFVLMILLCILNVIRHLICGNN